MKVTATLVPNFAIPEGFEDRLRAFLSRELFAGGVENVNPGGYPHLDPDEVVIEVEKANHRGEFEARRAASVGVEVEVEGPTVPDSIVGRITFDVLVSGQCHSPEAIATEVDRRLRHSVTAG